MRKTVARSVPTGEPGRAVFSGELYGPGGERKYVNAEERRRLLAATAQLPRRRAIFARLLLWTGARVSEVLALTPCSFQISAGLVTFVTLKRRGFAVRELPIPPDLMADIAGEFDLTWVQQGEAAATRHLFGFHRVTAWRLIKDLMQGVGITGRRACPRGLRHGFGVGTLQRGVPLNVIQKWMGHARMTTTAIYANVCGPEELFFARRFWGDTPSQISHEPAVRAI